MESKPRYVLALIINDDKKSDWLILLMREDNGDAINGEKPLMFGTIVARCMYMYLLMRIAN